MSLSKDQSDVGKMLLGLQDKLNYLQSALSNIDSGYSKQVSLLSTHVEKIQSDVKSKADQLLDKFMNGEVTVQELPGIKIRETIPRKPLSMAGQMQLQSFSKPPREDYKGKRERRRNTTASRQSPLDYVEAPCISEDDISKGMLNLINRGIIPKDVDLTPAFERGAPPLMNRAAPLYPSALRNEKVFISSGLPENPHIKYDFNTAETARLEPASTKKPKIQYVEPIIERLAIKESPVPHKGSERILDPREYNELMDTFSSHFFIIRKGVTLDTTPEFLSYARTYSFDWDRIKSLIKLMEDLTKRYKLEKVKVDGKMLSDIKVRKVADEDLMVCIVDYEELLKKIKMPRLLFRTKNGPELAAAKIQATWKMHKDRQKYKIFLKLSNTAKVIQAAFRRFLRVKTARKSAAMEFKKRMDSWKAMQEKFKQDWPTMKESKRLEIHLPSLSYDESLRVTMDRFSVRQNLQIARLFNLQDDNLSMIYLSGFNIPEEIMNYYRRVLELSGIGGIDRRLKVIHPSVQGSILPHMSITKAILCSSDTLRQLKRLVAGQQAYIVPAVMSRDEVELSMILKIPILGGDPYKTSLFSTKSGCRRIFSAATIPTPPGAFDIYEEREFMATLTRLIAKNLSYDTWIFKIDNEFNGRGHAWLEVGSMKLIKSLREQKDELSEEQQEALYQYLYKALPNKVKLATPNLYISWQRFLKELVKSGGVIEATPNQPTSKIGSVKISFWIEPDGSVNLLGGFDKVECRRYVTGGYLFPQKSLVNINLKLLLTSIAKVLYEKDIIGHVSIDLVSFQEKGVPHPLFWAVDLKCEMTDVASVMPFFNFLIQGEMENVSGRYFVQSTGRASVTSSKSRLEDMPRMIREERHFLYVPQIKYSGIGKMLYKSFFSMCKMRGISFDLEERKGITFLLPDSLQSSIIGLLAMGRRAEESISLMHNTISFISESFPDKLLNLELTYSDEQNFGEILSMIKILHKRQERKKKRINIHSNL